MTAANVNAHIGTETQRARGRSSLVSVESFVPSCVLCASADVDSGDAHDRVRPPPPAHRVQPARRGVPHRRAGRPGGEAGHEGAGHHRPRQHVRRGGLPRRLPRAQGIKPILGCEIYVATGQPARASRARGIEEAYNHLTLLASRRGRLPQPGEARLDRLHRGLLPPAAHRQGACWRSTARASSASPAACPARSPATCATGRRRPRSSRSGEFAEIFGRTASTSRSWTTASRSSGASTRRWSACTAQTGLPLVATNDAHYLREDDHQAHDVLLCIGSGKKVHDTERLRFDTEEFYLKSAEEMARGLPRPAGGARQHRRRSPRCATSRSSGAARCPPSTCRPASPSRATSRRWRATASRSGCKALGAAGRGRAAAPPPGRLRGAARQGDRGHPARGLRRLLPDRLGLHPLRARAGHPGRARPRLGRGQPRGLLPAHHRHRPHRARPHLRALPERGAHQPARHRHRLLREPARRGHRVRHAQVRPRERGPDHHLRDHEGARRWCATWAACWT